MDIDVAVLVAPMTSAPRSAALRPPYLVSAGARESAPDRLEALDAALRFVLGL